MLQDYSSESNVYEHGILVEGSARPESLRLLATARLPIHSGFSLSIVDLNGHSLNERAVNFANVKGPHRTADYYENSDLRYCVLALLYHVDRLVDLYVSITQRFDPLGTAIEGNTGDPRVFYEIDAFLWSARRVYESVKDVLWKHYTPRGSEGKWKSFRRVAESPQEIPPILVTELKDSWNNFGKKLADYRDCLTHYVPLNEGGATCWMNRYGDRWGMTVKLPANPEKNSRRVFDFGSGPDALTYCHSVACHIVGLCESLESQTKIAWYLANPQAH